MKKRLQGFVAGVITTLMLTGVFALAIDVYESISVVTNDIRIEIDGERFIPTNVNGDIVKPFIYEGSTYLPVRAIATAFNMDVAWDADTYTVSLTTKNTEGGIEPENDDVAENLHIDFYMFLGTWYADISGMLTGLGVPEEIMKDYAIYAVCEFKEDGTYCIYMDDVAINALVDASFKYALSAHGITEKQYPEFAGISVEEAKDAIKAEINPDDLKENGTYSIENGKLVLTVEGNPAEYYSCVFNNDILKICGKQEIVLKRSIS